VPRGAGGDAVLGASQKIEGQAVRGEAYRPLQGECLDYRYEPMYAGELQKVVDARLDKCRHYRPRESLGFLTLSKRSAILGVPIPKRAGVQ